MSEAEESEWHECDLRYRNPSLEVDWQADGSGVYDYRREICRQPAWNEVGDLWFCNIHYRVVLRALKIAAAHGGVRDLALPHEVTDAVLDGDDQRRQAHRFRQDDALRKARAAVDNRLTRIAKGEIA